MIRIIDDEKKIGTEIFEDLDVGDTFLYHGKLYIKCDKIRDMALNLSDEGDLEGFSVDAQVIPVDIEIKVIR
jgi:tartrate dehydratase beta subunit/fumarate hydratase class I family protein